MRRLWKPWYVHNPRMLLQRWQYRAATHTRAYVPWPTAWGAQLCVDPTGVIGREVAMSGVFDLALTECLLRLITPASTVIDVGGNVGYTTVLAALTAGPSGRVITFEPMPSLARVLAGNLEANGVSARVELHQCALGRVSGTAVLHLPRGFADNDGLATLKAGPSTDDGIDVEVRRLDDVFDGTATLMKLDVEGFESEVLRGARALISEQRVEHVVFEDYDIVHSDTPRLLREAGYTIFAVHHDMLGLKHRRLEEGPFDTGIDAPNFVATLSPSEVGRALAPRGFRSLRAIRSRPT